MNLGCNEYIDNLFLSIKDRDWTDLERVADVIMSAWVANRSVFLCGNGGSAANAMHLANDFLYGVGGGEKKGLRVEALSSNSSVLTCLANDVGYDEIFSIQLETKGRDGDVLIVLSGSGNSRNVVRAVEKANALGISTIGILGYSGGICLTKVDYPIHFAISDMQIAEDLQLVVGHILMQGLKRESGIF